MSYSLKIFFDICMKILSFDTTNNLASVAILDNNELLAYNTSLENSQQAEKLFYLIEKSLKDSNLNFDQIDLISVTNGPGSFTGVRIGLAAALGLKMACQKKIIAISNLQVTAFYAKQNFNKNSKIAVAQDARKDEIYFQIFDENLNNITEPEIILRNSIKIDKDVQLIERKVDAKLLAEATDFFWKSNLYQSLYPIYIRAPYVG